MKKHANVFYFPVDADEQALLLRVREEDLAKRVPEVIAMVEQLGEFKISPDDLELAIQLLLTSRQTESMDARFDNLEARLRDRMEKAFAEMEGRLFRHVATSPAPAPKEPRAAAPPPPPSPAPPAPPTEGDVPEKANLAFRIGSEVVWGPSASQFYVAIWRWLLQHHKVRLSDLPLRSGKLRYAAASEPVHPSGKEFTRHEEPVPGVFIEVNLSRYDIFQRARKYLTDRGVPFEVLVGPE